MSQEAGFLYSLQMALKLQGEFIFYKSNLQENGFKITNQAKGYDDSIDNDQGVKHFIANFFTFIKIFREVFENITK